MPMEDGKNRAVVIRKYEWEIIYGTIISFFEAYTPCFCQDKLYLVLKINLNYKPK